MKKIYLLLLAATLLSIKTTLAQVTVSGSTGADGSYTSLTQIGGAFATINGAGSQAGNNILITVTADVTTENGANSLNNGGWTTCTINPAGTRILSGTVALPLINLNGANNVRIDGLNSGGNSLTISNASALTTAGTSVIRFINDASNNTVTNCTILGSGTGVVGSLSTGTIIFAGTTGATGNDNNSITNNNIGDATTVPSIAISSFGQSAALSNDNNTISGNNIYNYFLIAASNAINIGSNSSAWTISNNRFYQTAARAGATGFQKAIAINTTSGGNYTISNNTIGYATSAGTGTMTYSPGTAARFTAIELAVAATPVSNIQGNTITAISFGTSSGANTLGAGIFHGIIVTAGGVNIGTTSGNTIGATSGTGSIVITSTTNGGFIHGIYATSTAAVNIQNNNLGSIATGGAATIGYFFMGIHIAGSGSHIVERNTIGNTTANNITMGTLATTTGNTGMYGIRSASSGTTVSMGTTGNGNTVQNMTNYSTHVNSLVYGLFNSGSSGTLHMSGNTITTNTLYGGGSSGTTNYFMSVYNSGTVSTAINIRSNIMSAGNVATASFGGTAGFISVLGAGAASTVTISDNVCNGLSYTGATGGNASGAFLGIDQEANPATEVISNNEFNNISLKNAGFTAIIYADNDVPNVTISSNFITTGFTCTSASTIGFVGIYNIGGLGSITAGTQTVSNNNFTNISINNSTATVYGILFEPGASSTSGPSVTVSGNTLSITNSGTSDLNGIFADFSTALSINNNTIQALVTGGSTVYGMQSHFFSGTASVYKNKIYGITNNGATGVVNGMNFGNVTSTATNTINIYNNLIGGLSAPSSSGNNQVNGISLTGIAANTYNVYYNSVYLNTAGGANFGTAALLANTTPTVNLRNNILVNLSTPSGTGRTTAYQRSSTTLTTYASTSNNNLLYAGTPGASNVIYYDGTNADQTLAAFKTRMITRDGLSVTENPPFLSTAGASPSFLHINPAIGTQVESGAVNIASYTTDYDNDIRQGNGGYTGVSTLGPDIGADEGDFTFADISGPSIAYTLLSNTFCLTNPSFTATVSDLSGVNSIGGTKPRVYYKRSTDANTWVDNTPGTNGWKYTEATNASSPFSFTIDYTLLSGGTGVVSGDVIQYFVVAQDNNLTPNVGINNGTFTLQPASVNLTAAEFPLTGTINSYNISAGVAASITVGAAGTYPTLTGAGGLFEAINNNGLVVNTTATIISNITEPGTVGLLESTFGCSPGSFNLVIKPNAAGIVLTGAVNSTALIRILKNNVELNGSSTLGTSQDLTIINTSTTGPNVILLGSTGTTPITGSSVKNCIIENGINSASALVVTDATAPGSPGYFNNITLTNNLIRKAYIGIYTSAVVAASNGNGLTITNNQLNSTAANAIRLVGIYVQGADATGGVISGNQIANLSGTSADIDRGIWLAAGVSNMRVTGNTISTLTGTGTGGFPIGIQVNCGVAASGIEVSSNTISGLTSGGTTGTVNGTSGIYITGATGGVKVFGNTITNIKNTNGTGYGANGIQLSSTLTAADITVSNNFVSDIAAAGFNGYTVPDNGYGIAISTGAGYKIYYNSVNMNTNQTAAGGRPAALLVESAVTTVGAIDLRNNIFANNMTAGSTQKYAIIYGGTSNTIFSNIDYNDYYTAAGANLGRINSTDRTNLAAIVTGFGGNANSLNIQPNFTTATNLHLVAGTNCGLNGRAIPIATFTTDIDADPRDAATPDIGADEFVSTPSTTLAGIVSTTVCDSRGVSVAGTNFTTNACNLIATVLPSGVSPVTGTVNACVYISPATVPVYNAEPYVQRHIDIVPATSPLTSTGRITLYFTDAEFVTFNANNASWPDLPTSAGGGNADPNIANLRVSQFHGTPLTTPSSPNQYSAGTSVLINPSDVDVVWNGNYWAVSFDVTGFSGFYIHTNLRYVLPIEVNYFRGSKQGSNHLLNWKVTCNSTPKATLILERSSSATGGFAPIYSIEATAARCNQPFDYTDAQPLPGMNYYRVKMIDVNGKITYSGIVALLNATKGFDIVSIAPNPVVNGTFKLNATAAQASKMDVVIIDMQGRVVKREQISLSAGFTSTEMNVADLSSGTYSLYGVTADGRSSVLRFVKQ